MQLTREKHLDHMVKVVPFIVTCYAIQCFAIIKIGPAELAGVSLMALGGLLSFMIGAFITYDLNHKVDFFHDHFVISFLGRKKIVTYDDIFSIDVSEPGQSFSSLTIKTSYNRITFYFVDDAEKIKAFIEKNKMEQLQEAA